MYKELWGDQGAGERRPHGQRNERSQRGDQPDQPQDERDVRLRPGIGRAKQRQRTDPGVLRDPVPDAVDMFIPAASPPTGTVRVGSQVSGVRAYSRGELPELPVVQQHGLTVQFNDFER